MKVEIECTEEQWRAMPESATHGRRCLRCILLGVHPPGRARYTHRYGSLCRWCVLVDYKRLRLEYPGIKLQPIIDD